MVRQVSNEMMVLECPERFLAQFLMDYLNALPRKSVPRVKVPRMYEYLYLKRQRRKKKK